jgi:hypothetical protein
VHVLMPRLGDHRLTLALFFVVLAIFLVMGNFFPKELVVPLPGSDIRPVLLLEFASKPQHLVHIFGEASDPNHAVRLFRMNTGNAIDYLLMPAYGLLTFSFFRSIATELPGKLWQMFAWMGIIAALADAIENALMFRMVADMANPLDEMAILPFPVWTKFGLLAVSCAGAALAFVRLRRWLLALICLPAPFLLVPGMLDPYGLGPQSTALIGLGWLAMAVHAFTRWRNSLQT